MISDPAALFDLVVPLDPVVPVSSHPIGLEHGSLIGASGPVRPSGSVGTTGHWLSLNLARSDPMAPSNLVAQLDPDLR